MSDHRETERANLVIKEITGHNAHLDNDTRHIKYKKMKESAFAFYRATAHLFYRDLAGWFPREKWDTGAITWLQGDFHFQNAGFFENSRGKIIFDLNDFDDSCPGPFYWDLLRFTPCLYLVTPGFSLSPGTREQLAGCFLDTYHEVLKKGEKKSNRLMKGFVKKRRNIIKNQRNRKTLLDKWTRKGEFNFSDSRLAPPSPEEKEMLSRLWQTTGKPGTPRYAKRLLSGLGSLGMEKYYLLLPRQKGILEIKQQDFPAMFSYPFLSREEYIRRFSSHGQRAAAAAGALLREKGFSFFTRDEKSFLIRRLSPYKDNFEPGDFSSPEELEDFLKTSAGILARAHAGAGKSRGYDFRKKVLEESSQRKNWKREILEAGIMIAGQMEEDFQAFNARTPTEPAHP